MPHVYDINWLMVHDATMKRPEFPRAHGTCVSCDHIIIVHNCQKASHMSPMSAAASLSYE